MVGVPSGSNSLPATVFNHKATPRRNSQSESREKASGAPQLRFSCSNIDKSRGIKGRGEHILSQQKVAAYTLKPGPKLFGYVKKHEHLSSNPPVESFVDRITLSHMGSCRNLHLA